MPHPTAAVPLAKDNLAPIPHAPTKRSSALGAGPGNDVVNEAHGVMISPKELARMGVLGLSCMLCRLKMLYIPYVASAHHQAREEE